MVRIIRTPTHDVAGFVLRCYTRNHKNEAALGTKLAKQLPARRAGGYRP